MRVQHAPTCSTSHALFRWRVRRHKVDGDEIPTDRSVRLGVVFLPRWRVYPNNARVRAPNRLNLRPRFSLSPARKSAGESPNVWYFSFRSLDFRFCVFSWFWFNFGAISLGLVRLGPPIRIHWMSMLHFGPPSFNFRIGFKLFNKYSTEVLIYSIWSFSWNW